ncbi:hypothetical protein RDI58_018387 [Solanum bulbocastanum]
MEKERMHLQPLSHIHLPRHDIDSRQSALLQPVTAIDWGESASLTAGTDAQLIRQLSGCKRKRLVHNSES